MATLTFVEQGYLFSTYRRANGTTVDLPARTFQVEFDKDDFVRVWVDEFRRSQPGHTARLRFLAFVRTIFIDGDDIADDVRWCTYCHDVDLGEDGFVVGHNGDEFACESCYDDHYSKCDRCEDSFTSLSSTLHDTSVCEGCRDGYYSFCDDCDGYYDDNYSGEHEHNEEGNGCCESPAMGFVVRNDGDPLLANDTQVSITLPAGTIDGEGLTRIKRYIEGQGNWQISGLIDALGDKWQTKDGNFTKRLSKAAHKQRKEFEVKRDQAIASDRQDHVRHWDEAIEQMKVKPALLSMVGTIAGEHSQAVNFRISVTRDLNQSAAEFAHSESCWWQSYSNGRCALKTNGGFALRTFDDYGDVTGRAWVMPLKHVGAVLQPTFETEEPEAFVVFNGYRKLEGYSACRIISHMAGMTYRKITFQCSPMFVNGDSGYLVAPEEIAESYTDGSLYLEVEQHSRLFHNELAIKAAAAKAAVITETPKELLHV